KGDPILRLSNPDVEFQLAGQTTQVSTMLASMQYSRVTAEQNTVVKLTGMADVQSFFVEAERVYNVDKRLYEKKALGLQNYLSARNNYNYYLEKKRLQERILQQDTVSRQQQAQQDNESLERAKNTLDILKRKVDALIIRAPVDGQLTSLDAEVGQQRPPGYALGQLDVLDGFKVRL